MHRDITDIFNDANSAAGQHGQITFQASGDWSFMALDSGRTAGAGLLA
jgi:VCBS repeat-containing protein